VLSGFSWAEPVLPPAHPLHCGAEIAGALHPERPSEFTTHTHHTHTMRSKQTLLSLTAMPRRMRRISFNLLSGAAQRKPCQLVLDNGLSSRARILLRAPLTG